MSRDAAEQIQDQLVEQGFASTPVARLILDAAKKKLKLNEMYMCINDHRFKGKEIVITPEKDEETNDVTAIMTCPDCGIDKILLINPLLKVSLDF